jgi:hypothetical protein
MCRMSFSYRKTRDHDVEELPPYRPIAEGAPVVKYSFDVSSPGTMTIATRGDGTFKVSHMPSRGTRSTAGTPGRPVHADHRESLRLEDASTREEKLEETKLRLTEARARFQESMDRLHQELTLVKNDESMVLLDEEDDEEGLEGPKESLKSFEHSDSMALVKI